MENNSKTTKKTYQKINLDKIYSQESVVRRLGYAEKIHFHTNILDNVKDKFHNMYLEIIEMIAETGRDTKYRNIMTLEKAQNILNVKVTDNIIKPVANPGGWANKKKKQRITSGNPVITSGNPVIDREVANSAIDGGDKIVIENEKQEEQKEQKEQKEEKEQKEQKEQKDQKDQKEQKMKLLKGKVLDTSFIVSKSKSPKSMFFEEEKEKEKENGNSKPKRPYKKSRKQLEKEEYLKSLVRASPVKYYPFLKERSIEFHNQLQDLTIHDLKIPTFRKEDEDTSLQKGIERKINFFSDPKFENWFILAPTTFFKAIRHDARQFGKIQFTRESIFLIQLVTEMYIRDYLKKLKLINDKIIEYENKKSKYVTRTSLEIYDTLKHSKSSRHLL